MPPLDAAGSARVTGPTRCQLRAVGKEYASRELCSTTWTSMYCAATDTAMANATAPKNTFTLRPPFYDSRPYVWSAGRDGNRPGV